MPSAASASIMPSRSMPCGELRRRTRTMSADGRRHRDTAARRRPRPRAAGCSARPPVAQVKNPVELLELGDAERGRQLVEAVVVADALVVERLAVRRPWFARLFTSSHSSSRCAGRRRPRQSSSACSDRRRRLPGPEGADRPPAVGRPECLASVLDDGNAVAVGDLPEGVEIQG